MYKGLHHIAYIIHAHAFQFGLCWLVQSFLPPFLKKFVVSGSSNHTRNLGDNTEIATQFGVLDDVHGVLGEVRFRGSMRFPGIIEFTLPETKVCLVGFDGKLLS